MMRYKIQTSLLIAAMMGLIACGGGSGKDEANEERNETAGCYQIMTYTNDRDTDGVIDTKADFTYDTNGSISSLYFHSYHSEIDDINITYRYEGKKLYENIEFNNEQKDEKRVYEYNDDRKKVFVSYTDGDDSPYHQESYTYNEDGSLKTLILDDPYVSTRIIYTYDENGYEIKRYIEYEVNGVTEGINQLVKYTHDIYGNKIKEERYTGLYEEDDANEDTLFTTITYTYDSNNHRLTKKEEDYMLTKYTYDEQGNRVTEERDYDIDDTIDRTTIFAYDENHNLIRKSWDSNLSDDITDNTFYLTWKKFLNCPPSPYSQFLWWN